MCGPMSLHACECLTCHFTAVTIQIAPDVHAHTYFLSTHPQFSTCAWVIPSFYFLPPPLNPFYLLSFCALFLFLIFVHSVKKPQVHRYMLSHPITPHVKMSHLIEKCSEKRCRIFNIKNTSHTHYVVIQYFKKIEQGSCPSLSGQWQHYDGV